MSSSGRAQVALSTGSLFIWSLERVFGLAQAAGYDGVEVLVDSRMESFDAAYLNKLQESTGSRIVSVHTPFADDVEGWPNAPEGRVEMAVRLAERVGAQTVVAHLPLRHPIGHVQMGIGRRVWRREVLLPWADRQGTRYLRWLKEEMPVVQAQTSVRIAVENMPARRLFGRRVRLHYCNRVEQLAQFPYLVLDTTHWGTCGVEPVRVFEALRERIIHVHLADYDGREHRVPFTGHLALYQLLQQMGKVGFSGAVVVETQPWALADSDWKEAHLLGALRDVRQRIQQQLEAPSHSHEGLARTRARPADRLP